jgi:hypothetical protein
MSKKRKRKRKTNFFPVLQQFEALLDEVSEVPFLPSSGVFGENSSPSEARPHEEKLTGKVVSLNTPSASIFLEQVQQIFLRRIRESKERDF